MTAPSPNFQSAGVMSADRTAVIGVQPTPLASYPQAVRAGVDPVGSAA
jgi:hypothetical protein